MIGWVGDVGTWGPLTAREVRRSVIDSLPVALFTAVFAGGLALPLFVTRALHQQAASVGVLFSVCAAGEAVAARALPAA